MYYGLLILAGGVLAKSLAVILPKFKKKDWLPIVISLIIACYVFIRMAGDWRIEDAALIALIAYISSIAFSFRERVLPRITEGTLL
jgi:sorbitol-specific phosphotransferase system component IIC